MEEICLVTATVPSVTGKDFCHYLITWIPTGRWLLINWLPVPEIVFTWGGMYKGIRQHLFSMIGIQLWDSFQYEDVASPGKGIGNPNVEKKNDFVISIMGIPLTHHGLDMTYGDIDLGQHWFR